MGKIEPVWEQGKKPRGTIWPWAVSLLLLVVCAAACVSAVSSRQEVARLQAELEAVSSKDPAEDFNIEGAKAYIEYLESQVSYSSGSVTMKPDFEALREQFHYEP